MSAISKARSTESNNNSLSWENGPGGENRTCALILYTHTHTPTLDDYRLHAEDRLEPRFTQHNATTHVQR